MGLEYANPSMQDSTVQKTWLSVLLPRASRLPLYAGSASSSTMVLDTRCCNVANNLHNFRPPPYFPLLFYLFFTRYLLCSIISNISTLPFFSLSRTYEKVVFSSLHMLLPSRLPLLHWTCMVHKLKSTPWEIDFKVNTSGNQLSFKSTFRGAGFEVETSGCWFHLSLL